MEVIPYLAVGSSLAALLLAFFFARVVMGADEGTDKMKEVGEAIREGAMAFFRVEFRWVSVFVAGTAAIIFTVLEYGRPWGAIAFVAGALLSSIAGFVGMRIATQANTRTAHAAMVGGAQQALPLAFRCGAAMGFTVAGLGLLGISLAYTLFVEVMEVDEAFQVVAAFGLGGSSIALFARIGGGIYIGATDAGADLVGKVEAGIREGDPRNPATIADTVGDNVGEVAGMGADLFESYAHAMVATIVLTSLIFNGVTANGALQFVDELRNLYVFPLLIGALGMVASIIAALVVGAGGNATHSSKLRRGQYVAFGLMSVFALGASQYVFREFEFVDQPLYLGLTIIVGMVAGWAIGFTSQYFTSPRFRSVKSLAEQTENGPAPVVIDGLGLGMLSTTPAVIVMVATISAAYWLGGEAFIPAITASGEIDSGLYGVALAAIGMLATTATAVAVQAYGSMANNAGGIADMAELPPEVREVTDSLDSVGNTTAAIAKGLAIGSAALTAFALFKAFSKAAGLDAIDLDEVAVTIGLFLGALTPFVFAALTIESVGRAAKQVIVEVRRQFVELPGLREGLPGVRPEYARCVEISTNAALREMVLPGSLAVVIPLAIGFISVEALGGFLAGSVVTGFIIAIFMANAGGAWGNASRYLEAGAHGGKGSYAHGSAVVGGSVGDLFKDTAGPSMSTLIKVMTIVSLVFVPLFLR